MVVWVLQSQEVNGRDATNKCSGRENIKVEILKCNMLLERKHQGSTAEESSVQKLNQGKRKKVLKPANEVRKDK